MLGILIVVSYAATYRLSLDSHDPIFKHFPTTIRASTWDSGVNNFLPPFGTFGPFDDHLCPSGGKTRTAKNTDGSDLHLLSAGSNRAYHLLIPLYEESHRRKDPSFSCSRGGLYEG